MRPGIQRNVGCRYIANLADKTEPFARHRPDQPLFLTAVADCLAHGIDVACQCGFRNNPPVPDVVENVVLTDHMVTVLDQINKQIKHLWSHGDRFWPAGKFPPAWIKHIVTEMKWHSLVLTRIRTGTQKACLG